jgi:RNA polymerase sigma factor (sigma-70 family)
MPVSEKYGGHCASKRITDQVSCSNDKRAFVQLLFERHRDALLRHVRNLLGTRTDAEDIVQETWSRLLRADNLQRHQGRARSYMFRVATNIAFDRHRRRRETSLENPEELAEAASVAGPDAIAEMDQAIEAITQTLLAIRPRSRKVFLMRTAEELSFEAIAERLGISKRTVEREMKHALDACQRRLRRNTE